MALTKQQQGWVKSIAAASGYDYAVLAALIDKESNGKFYWNVGGKSLPALNIEGHYFYKYLALLAPDKLKQAVAAGLAAKKRGGIKVPTSYAGRYAFFERMQAVHREAAFMSVSSGVGQIMGDNYKAMGFTSAEALFNLAAASARNQIELIATFVSTKPPLVAAVLNRDVKGIAYYYNGPQYRVNQYDTKLQALIDFYDGKAGQPEPASYDGSGDIQALGYSSVEQFQRENGLIPDGVIGKLTLDKIDEVKAARKKKARKPAVTVGTAVGTTTAAAGTAIIVTDGAQSVTDVVDKVQPVIETVQAVGAISPKLVVVLVAALIVGVVAYVVIQKLRKR